MTIDSFIMDLENNIYNANLCKEIVLNKLLLDGVITDKQYDEYCIQWNIIIVKESWYKKFFKSDNKNGYFFKYVKF
jgi:hypothetical protein